MTTAEVKTETIRIIDELPEEALPGILDFLKKLQAQSLEKARLDNFVKKILEEDDELFRRLAE